MHRSEPTRTAILVKTIVTHTVTYSIAGYLAFTLLDYPTYLAHSSLNRMMRPTTDPMVMAGPLFQPIRGLLFGIVFALLREPFFARERGWLLMWATLLIVGIVSPFGPSPGSVEGMIYAVFPLGDQLRGLPEVILQSLALSVVVAYWVRRPDARWLSWLMGVTFVVVTSLPALGLLVRPR